MPRKGLCSENILQAAVGLLDERGLEGFSLRELAARLGVQPASLYNHVEGVAELEIALGVEAARQMSETLFRAISGLEPDDAFLSAARTYRDYALQHPERYQALMRMPSSDERQILAASWDSFAPFRELVAGYGASRQRTVHYLRSLRAALHGFLSLEAAGFMRHYDLSTSESYEQMIRDYLCTLKRLASSRPSR